MKDKKEKIKYHYEVAAGLIKMNENKKAEYEILNRLPEDLYDYSLTILNSRAVTEDDIYLKDLINNVLAKIK